MTLGPIQFKLSLTQKAYVYSRAVVNAIISNTGEGKTYASVVALPHHARRNGKPIRAAIVRDTHDNIKKSTVRSIQEAFETHPHLIRFKNDYKELIIRTNPAVMVDLFGIDDPASLSKLQGVEYALIWLEEPAPMQERTNAGLSEEVFNAALVRCARQKGTIPRLQISMNPADEHHWTFRRLIEDPMVDPDTPLITRRVWFVPYGENRHVSEISRQAVKAAYKDDPASYQRYVKGEFATVYQGQKVAPEYNPDLHRSKLALEPAYGLMGFRFWDGWHNPTCVMGQVTTVGRLIVLNTLRLDGGDIRGLIKYQVKPMMESPRWKGKCKAWRDIGDRSMRQPDQSNRQESAARVVETELDTLFEPGPGIWDILKQGLKRALNMNIMGMPALYFDPCNTLLHKGLSGEWHYRTDPSGNILKGNKVPFKNEVSHACDALANGVSIMLPAIDVGDLGDYKKARVREKMMASSYAASGGTYGPS